MPTLAGPTFNMHNQPSQPTTIAPRFQMDPQQAHLDPTAAAGRADTQGVQQAIAETAPEAAQPAPQQPQQAQQPQQQAPPQMQPPQQPPGLMAPGATAPAWYVGGTGSVLYGDGMGPVTANIPPLNKMGRALAALVFHKQALGPLATLEVSQAAGKSQGSPVKRQKSWSRSYPRPVTSPAGTTNTPDGSLGAKLASTLLRMVVAERDQDACHSGRKKKKEKQASGGVQRPRTTRVDAVGGNSSTSVQVSKRVGAGRGSKGAGGPGSSSTSVQVSERAGAGRGSQGTGAGGTGSRPATTPAHARVPVTHKQADFFDMLLDRHAIGQASPLLGAAGETGRQIMHPQDLSDIDWRELPPILSLTSFPLIAGGAGALAAPSGHRVEGLGRGLGYSLGMGLGRSVGDVAAYAGGLSPGWRLGANLAGLIGGGLAARRVMGEPSWERKRKQREAGQTKESRSKRAASPGLMPGSEVVDATPGVKANLPTTAESLNRIGINPFGPAANSYIRLAKRWQQLEDFTPQAVKQDLGGNTAYWDLLQSQDILSDQLGAMRGLPPAWFKVPDPTQWRGAGWQPHYPPQPAAAVPAR